VGEGIDEITTIGVVVVVVAGTMNTAGVAVRDLGDVGTAAAAAAVAVVLMEAVGNEMNAVDLVHQCAGHALDPDPDHGHILGLEAGTTVLGRARILIDLIITPCFSFFSLCFLDANKGASGPEECCMKYLLL
jgi:hypothetical protein